MLAYYHKTTVGFVSIQLSQNTGNNRGGGEYTVFRTNAGNL